MANFLCFIFFFLSVDHLVQSAKPVLNRQMINTASQSEGSNYVLVCSISTGSTPIRFTWSFNSRPLQKSSQFSVESTEMLSLLKISPVQRSHAGNYSCLAENGKGADSLWLVLKVEGKQEVFEVDIFLCVSYLAKTWRQF